MRTRWKGLFIVLMCGIAFAYGLVLTVDVAEGIRAYYAQPAEKRARNIWGQPLDLDRCSTVLQWTEECAE